MSSRRRSLLKRERAGGNEIEALEALEVTEESDLEFEDDDDELDDSFDEDLEVVESTLRGGSYGSFDEVGPPMDSAVMDEVTGELPSDGLWLDSKLDRLFQKADPEETEPTEPALPREELLPPMPNLPNHWGTPGVVDRKKAPKSRPEPEAAAPPVSTATQPGLERRATPDEIRLVSATPWIAAIGMSAMLAIVGLFGVILLAWLLRPQPFEPDVELGAQPPISGPIDGLEEAPDEPEVPVDEAPIEEEDAAEEPASAPGPRPAPAAPVPEPDDPWGTGEDLAPAPVPTPEPEPAPAPSPRKKRGLFGKKK